MSEERITRLESEVVDLRITQERIAGALEHIADSVKKFEPVAEAVRELTDTMNKGKGALWALGCMFTALGAIAAWITHWITK